ncbi:MAG: SpoVR family protein [Thermodesulfobacteriota bacterium]
MELIDQHTKKIMEGCKERARDAGLHFENETLEYIVTNRDLLELSPKLMIPTLYDYWVHDVEVIKEKRRYELYPNNPYETVINTRPAISFYNDNNPDWLNVMIFYHVIGHIDFFQNNLYYRHTWDYDFNGQALSDKRLIARLRSEKGRWVDYVIEFARSIDNIVGYHGELARLDRPAPSESSRRLDFYFDVFLQTEKKAKIHEYIKEIERYNEFKRTLGSLGEKAFFSSIVTKHPEFEALFEKSLEKKPQRPLDLLQFLMDHSPHLNREENVWMKSVLSVVRKTSIFFQPQIRTKIMNEGWASYWHEILFLQDDRIKGHEVDFARVNAGVTAMPRVGLNPYALGMRLFYHLEEIGDKGKYDLDFRELRGIREREDFNRKTGQGRDFIFTIRRNLCDYLFISDFIDQDFVNRHKLFVAGRRLNQNRAVYEYYVKSRNAEDYRQMLMEAMYHPPYITVDEKKSEHNLYIVHHFEGKALVRNYIANTMLGIEYLWGAPVHLETSEPAATQGAGQPVYPFGTSVAKSSDKPEPKKWQRVLYTMENRKLSKKVL